MKREPLITVTDAPAPRVAKLIGESLRRFNAEKSGIDDSRPLAVVVSNPDSVTASAAACWAGAALARSRASRPAPAASS